MINNLSMSLNWSAGVLAIITVLVSGILGTFAYKLMGSQHVEEGGHNRLFYHPYMETFTMNIGQLLCLLLFFIKRNTYKQPLEEGKIKHNFRVFLIPGCCDATLSIMQYMALNFISGSTYRILVGGSIVTTLLFSKILLRIVIQKRHIAGCGLGVLGLVVVGLSSFLESKSSDAGDSSLQLLGYLLMIGSLLISGFLYSYEQLLLEKHTIHPLEMVGWEGFFGMIIVLSVSIILTFVPCNFGQDLCVYNSAGDLFFQRFDQFFRQVFSSWVLVLLVLVAILTVSFSNTSGVAVTKYYDSLTRCLVVMSKTAGVWIIGLIVTFSVGSNPDYQLESRSLNVNLVKFAGFVCIVIGTLIYNKVILAKYLLDKHHTSQLLLSQRSSQEQLLQKSQDLS